MQKVLLGWLRCRACVHGLECNALSRRHARALFECKKQTNKKDYEGSNSSAKSSSTFSWLFGGYRIVILLFIGHNNRSTIPGGTKGWCLVPSSEWSSWAPLSSKFGTPLCYSLQSHGPTSPDDPVRWPPNPPPVSGMARIFEASSRRMNSKRFNTSSMPQRRITKAAP